MFSEVAGLGHPVFHSIIARNNLILRQVNVLKKVHEANLEVNKTCRKLIKVLTELQTVISCFRKLTGIGKQVISVYRQDRMKFLLGPDEASMAVEILVGAESHQRAKYCFQASGEALSRWVSKKVNDQKKGSHSRSRRPAGKEHGGKKSKPEFVKKD